MKFWQKKLVNLHDDVSRNASRDFCASRRWINLRYMVLSESKGRCSLCGRCVCDGVSLHVDHIKPRSLFPELAMDKSNLQVLCCECNIGKGNRDCIDWRHYNDLTIEDYEDMLGRLDDTPMSRVEIKDGIC